MKLQQSEWANQVGIFQSGLCLFVPHHLHWDEEGISSGPVWTQGTFKATSNSLNLHNGMWKLFEERTEKVQAYALNPKLSWKEGERQLSYLCRNTCMVTPRNPQYSVALHPSPGGLEMDISLLHQQTSVLKQLDSNWYLTRRAAVTIEPKRLPQLQSEHGPGAEYRSRLVEEYT